MHAISERSADASRAETSPPLHNPRVGLTWYFAASKSSRTISILFHRFVAPEMTSSPTPLRSIQTARAIAALLVVLHHLSLRFEQRVGGFNFLSVFDHFGFAGVDLFFVISGLIMVITCQQHFGHLTAAPQFLWRRVTRILPLYWLFTFIQLLAMALIPSATDRVSSAQDIVASFLLVPRSIYPILAPGWTLTYEMFFYIIFVLLFCIPKRFATRLLVAWGLITLCLYALQNTAGLTDTTDLLKLPVYGSPLTLEFLAGCLIGLIYQSGFHRYGGASLAIGTVWFFGGWIIVESLTDQSAEFGLTRVLVFGTASTFILYGMLALERQRTDNRIGHWIAHPWLIAIGDASYSLYLSHLLVINALAIVWSRLSIENPVFQAVYEVFIVGVCVLFALSTFRLIERPLLHWLRRKSQRVEPIQANAVLQ